MFKGHLCFLFYQPCISFAYFSLVLLIIFLSLIRILCILERLALSIMWLVSFFQFAVLPFDFAYDAFAFLFYLLKIINLFFLASAFQVIERPSALLFYQGVLPPERIWKLFMTSPFMIKSLIYLESILVQSVRYGSCWYFNTESTFHEITGKGACMVCAHSFKESQPVPQGQSHPNAPFSSVQSLNSFSSVQSLSHVRLFATPWIAAHQVSLSITQTHVHRVSDAIQPSHPLSSPSPPAPNPSQHQSLFQWISSSHEVAKVLEFHL